MASGVTVVPAHDRHPLVGRKAQRCSRTRILGRALDDLRCRAGGCRRGSRGPRLVNIQGVDDQRFPLAGCSTPATPRRTTGDSCRPPRRCAGRRAYPAGHCGALPPGLGCPQGRMRSPRRNVRVASQPGAAGRQGMVLRGRNVEPPTPRWWSGDRCGVLPH